MKSSFCKLEIIKSPFLIVRPSSRDHPEFTFAFVYLFFTVVSTLSVTFSPVGGGWSRQIVTPFSHFWFRCLRRLCTESLYLINALQLLSRESVIVEKALVRYNNEKKLIVTSQSTTVHNLTSIDSVFFISFIKDLSIFLLLYFMY